MLRILDRDDVLEFLRNRQNEEEIEKLKKELAEKRERIRQLREGEHIDEQHTSD